MTPDKPWRWVLDHFLNSLTDIKAGEEHPPHRIDMRLQLAGMVLAEIPGDDLEEMAHRDHAEALIDSYCSPDDQRGKRYEKALDAYLDILRLLKRGVGK